MSDLYPYADENRLAQPHSYMYPPLHGAAFFPAYKESRCAALDVLFAGGAHEGKCALPLKVALAAEEACRMPESEVLMPPLSWRRALRAEVLARAEDDSLNLPDINGRQPALVQTATVLDALLNALPEQGVATAAWVDFFLERFEITKRLYTAYALPSRKGEGKYDSYALYMRLALLLGTLCFYKEDLRGLNTLLKLNDVLCSAAEELHGQEALMTACALMLETACAARLRQRMRERNARS